VKCDGCHDLLIDRLGMTRCHVARGKPTDDIKECVWMWRYVLKHEHKNSVLVKLE
jgi:hypothetical protein